MATKQSADSIVQSGRGASSALSTSSSSVTLQPKHKQSPHVNVWRGNVWGARHIQVTSALPSSGSKPPSSKWERELG